MTVSTQTGDDRIKRAELHFHTKLSDDLSTVDLQEWLDRHAADCHTVAVTNLNNVQEFPLMAGLAKRAAVKLIGGASIGCIHKAGQAPSRVSVLVKTQEGVKALYRIVSALTDGAVTKAVIDAEREHLLIGSCGCHGELFRAAASDVSDEALARLAAWYDYIELFPAADETQREKYRRLYALGRACGIPVIAAGNSHFLRPEDAVARRVVCVVKGREDDGEQWHCRSAQEMLDEFAYLGDDAAREVVFTAPDALAARVDCLAPMEEACSLCVIDGAFRTVRETVHNRACERYGAPLPRAVQTRLDRELALLGESDKNATPYLVGAQLANMIAERGYGRFPRGMVGSTLIALLLGITEIDPLPPYYHCPRCHFHRTVTTVADGFDLPQAICPKCGAALMSDGHDIPCETFTGYDGDKMPDIAFNVPSALTDEVLDTLIHIHGKENITRLGIVLTMWRRLIDQYIGAYETAVGRRFSDEERHTVSSLLEGMKDSNTFREGGVMIKSPQVSFEEATPLQRIEEADHIGTATHLPYHALWNIFEKWDLLCHLTPELLKQLETASGRKPPEDVWRDPAVLALFYTAQTDDIPEHDTPFMKTALRVCRPRCFSELLKVNGFAHGIGTWWKNAERKIKEGSPVLSLSAFREDVFDALRRCGFDRREAFRIAESVRKGVFAHDDEANDELARQMAHKGVLAWYIGALKRMQYLFPKAHAVGYVMAAVRCAWYKVYEPTVFAEVTAELSVDDEELPF